MYCMRSSRRKGFKRSLMRCRTILMITRIRRSRGTCMRINLWHGRIARVFLLNMKNTGEPPVPRMWPIVISFAALIAIAGVGAWWWRFQTYHLAVVDTRILYRDGNRGPREFVNMVRIVRPKTIVSLVDDSEIADREKPEFKAEIAYAKNHRIPIQRIPI